jgi:hypothetical protein
MKIVKESININEKFEEKSDPVSDMGIGRIGIKDFNNTIEFLDHLYIILPHILGVKNMSEVKRKISLMRWDGIIPFDLYKIICKWASTNGPFLVNNEKVFNLHEIGGEGALPRLKYNNSINKIEENIPWPEYFRDKLIEMNIVNKKNLRDYYNNKITFRETKNYF